MYYANHRNMIKGVFFDSIEILNKLKKNNYFCYVLSNWSAETFIGMTEDYPFLKQFDGLLISGQDNLIKPDPAKNTGEPAKTKRPMKNNPCFFIQ